jgi:biotin carboxyl carrier protein
MPPEHAVYHHGPGSLEVSYRRQRDGRFAVAVADSGAVPAEGDPGAADYQAAAPMLVAVHQADDGWIDLEEGGRRHRLHVFRHGHRVWVQGPGGDVALTAVPRFPEAEPEMVAGGLVAPMPGTVLSVHVKSGDTVTAGQLLMIVEAMKMEHRITAPHAGVVGDVRARGGDQVGGGDLLAVIDEAT